MTYRDDDLAEEQRERALEAQLRGIDRGLVEKDALEARRRGLGQALRDAEDAIGKKRVKVPLPLLARIEIASPCHARWDEMTGDAQVRHCASCDKNVFDLSEMTAVEAEALLSRDGPIACVRLHRRADGTVITSDCPEGVSKKRQRRWLAAGAAVAGSLMATAAGLALTTTTTGEPCVIPLAPQVSTPAIAPLPAAVTPPNVSPALPPPIRPRPLMGIPARHDPPPVAPRRTR